MAAADHLSGLQFIKASPSDPQASGYYHQIRDRTGKESAALSWHKDTGTIFGVHVPVDRQRQGLATAMWNHAHQLSRENPDVIAPRHSSIRSGAGDAWAKAVGGEIPNRDLAHSYTGDG